LGKLGFLYGSPSRGGGRFLPLPRGLGKKTLGRFERRSLTAAEGQNACEKETISWGDSGRSSQAQTQKQMELELLLLRLNAVMAYRLRLQLERDC